MPFLVANNSNKSAAQLIAPGPWKVGILLAISNNKQCSARPPETVRMYAQALIGTIHTRAYVKATAIDRNPRNAGPSKIVRRYFTKFYWSVESWKKTLKIRAILKNALNSP